MSESTADLRALTELLAKGLAEAPDEVVVTAEGDEDELSIEVEVAEGDLGRVIGRGGRTAKALRQVLSAAASRQGTRCRLDILEPEEL
jgi:hypothetical protein